MQVVLLVGIQACGKSTFYQQRFADTHLRINLDMLRTRQRETRLLQTCLEIRQPFVIDKMNLTAEQRRRYVAPARAAGFQVVGYCFRASVGECLERNRRRSGRRRVPDAAIRRAGRQLELPSRAEGFDALYQVRLSSGGAFEVEDWPDQSA